VDSPGRATDEAANWCLDNNYNLEEALKWEDTRFKMRSTSKTMNKVAPP